MDKFERGVSGAAGPPDAGEVAVMALPGGGFGACQVAAVNANEYHHHHGGLAHLNISCDYPVPPEFDWLGGTAY
jgi:hypothetical protein